MPGKAMDKHDVEVHAFVIVRDCIAAIKVRFSVNQDETRAGV